MNGPRARAAGERVNVPRNDITAGECILFMAVQAIKNWGRYVQRPQSRAVEVGFKNLGF